MTDPCYGFNGHLCTASTQSWLRDRIADQTTLPVSHSDDSEGHAHFFPLPFFFFSRLCRRCWQPYSSHLNMQVTSLFATFFAFLTLVASLATQTRIITSSAGCTIGNLIGYSEESAQPSSLLQKRAASASPSAGPSATDLPKNTSGGMGPNPGAVAGGVILGVAVLATLIFGALWYRRRQQAQACCHCADLQS
ncbi:hypothetical protein FB45DRAFT_134005 [Roridomyces roridus]|uniref:Uncharacterized protein n=1 Tax=Roridomyces roridus TaxID=1738132 RepID=A0AAD7FFI0_9AGAR|nr:hypothetical protein FB45DRAFT_134005 [Roridomyces roridus]